MTPVPPSFLAWLPPLLLPLFFVASALIVATRSGWRDLAARFGTDTVPEGEAFRGASGAMGPEGGTPLGYNRCLRVTVGEAGIDLRLAWLLRFCAPALLLPWEQVESVQPCRLFWRPATEIRLAGETVRVVLRGNAARAVERQWALRRPAHT